MSEIVGADWSLARPSPAALGLAGYTFAIRYVSPLRDGQPNPKDLTGAELLALRAAGLSVGLVFESTAGRVLAGGAGAGRDDGQTAAARAAAIGYPLDCVIWWAVDQAVPDSALPQVQAYGEGFAASWPGAQHGPYGSYSVVEYCAGRFPRLWQTMAWSGGKLSAHADVLQRVGHYHPIPAGLVAGSFDENVLLNVATPFYGAGVVPPLPSPPGPAPAPIPTPAPVAFDVRNWRARQGDTGAVFVKLQGWLNRTYPAYSRISPVAPVYGPQTVAVLREWQRRVGITGPDANGTIIGPQTAGKLYAAGFRG